MVGPSVMAKLHVLFACRWGIVQMPCADLCSVSSSGIRRCSVFFVFLSDCFLDWELRSISLLVVAVRAWSACTVGGYWGYGPIYL